VRVLVYSPSAGTPEFLRSLKRYYERRVGLQLDETQILATTGGSEAVLFTFLACANEGDDVLVVEPFYTNYRAFAVMAGLNLVPVMSQGRDGFHLPPRDVFERALTPRTRIVMLCNPNNPTGTVYRREELRCSRACREHGLFLVWMRCIASSLYDGGVRAISALELMDMDDLVIVVVQSLEALQRVRHPSRLAGHAQCGGSRRGAAHGAGRLSPPASPSSSPSAPTTSARSTRARSSTSTAAAATCCNEGLRSIPGVALSKPRARSTACRACPSRTPRTSASGCCPGSSTKVRP
jgi:hypothetical protein